MGVCWGGWGDKGEFPALFEVVLECLNQLWGGIGGDGGDAGGGMLLSIGWEGVVEQTCRQLRDRGVGRGQHRYCEAGLTGVLGGASACGEGCSRA